MWCLDIIDGEAEACTVQYCTSPFVVGVVPLVYCCGFIDGGGGGCGCVVPSMSCVGVVSCDGTFVWLWLCGPFLSCG